MVKSCEWCKEKKKMLGDFPIWLTEKKNFKYFCSLSCLIHYKEIYDKKK